MTASHKRRPSPPSLRPSASSQRRRKMCSSAGAGAAFGRDHEREHNEISATVNLNREWCRICESILRYGWVPEDEDEPQDLDDYAAAEDLDKDEDGEDRDGVHVDALEDEDFGFGATAEGAHVINLLPSSSQPAAAEQSQPPAEQSEPAEDSGEAHPDDPWLDNALRLSDSISQMSALLIRHSEEYANLYAAFPSRSRSGVRSYARENNGNKEERMTDADRNELEATVASFAVSTGNQIEALRHALEVHGLDESSDVAVHRSGIVSCLLSNLRSDVVDRLNALQSLRRRKSLRAMRDLLACRLAEDDGLGLEGGGGGAGDLGDGIVGMLGSLGEGMAEYINTAAALTGEEEMERQREEELDFDLTYGRRGEEALLKDASMVPVFPRADGPSGYDEDDAFSDEEGKVKADEKDDDVRGGVGGLIGAKLYDHRSPDANAASIVGKKASGPKLPSRPSQPKSVTIIPPNQDDVMNQLAAQYGETAAEHEAYVEDLQRESAYLTASLQTELEDVRKIETRMSEIVSLLTQFGDLVSEQQEDIVAIHDKTEKSKENLEKGQGQLVDATERKKASKHRMATFIVVMACLLLFFNWVIP